MSLKLPDSMSSGEQASQSFTGFPFLPKELRLDIWIQALPPSRYLRVWPDIDRSSHPFDTAAIISDLSTGPVKEKNISQILGLLLACKESKKVFLESYRVIPGGYHKRYDGDNLMNIQAYVDYQRDTLILSTESARLLSTSINNPYILSVHSLALEYCGLKHEVADPESPFATKNQLSTFLQRFSQLESLIILSEPMVFPGRHYTPYRIALLEIDDKIRDLEYSGNSRVPESSLWKYKWLARTRQQTDANTRKHLRDQSTPELERISVKVGIPARIFGPSCDNPNSDSARDMAHSLSIQGIEVEMHAVCEWDGTLIPYWDDFRGIAEMVDGAWL